MNAKNFPLALAELRGQLAATHANIAQASAQVAEVLGLPAPAALPLPADLPGVVVALSAAVNDLRALAGLDPVPSSDKPLTLSAVALNAGLLVAQALETLDHVERLTGGMERLAAKTAILAYVPPLEARQDVPAVEPTPEPASTAEAAPEAATVEQTTEEQGIAHAVEQQAAEYTADPVEAVTTRKPRRRKAT